MRLSPPPLPERSPVRPRAGRWRGFGSAFAGAVAAFGLGAVGLVALVDPYGLRAGPGRPVGPIMDGNQRFTAPQIARSGAYDAAVFGTSTARLLDPGALDAAFGGRFANLAVNAATPDEQRSLASLFLDAGPTRAVVFGLDATWCAADSPARTAHPFPDWLYWPGTPGGVWRQANLQGLAAAGRVLLARLGLAAPRFRGDGYAVFTPPESGYDAARARRHIAAATVVDPEAGGRGTGPAAAEKAAEHPDAAMPALAVLDALLARLPDASLKLVAFMPVHAAAQGQPGTAQGRREAACKARVAAIGRARGAVVVDFRLPSAVTTRDENYWDALHYRLPVAARIVAGLSAAVETGRDAGDGFYRVLAHPGRPRAAAR